ncbi:uncharacterized protein MYCFIDRAFT_210858 [Pseudocercospora fijiensis CIRAD86]|uniref:Uncharacterized protein n=1 Tax=Pseudocercospora fijiensis (strain CIRAD86) TaxID=383855 RepID=M2ZZM1_PSEFD|nr:uncharacterized protein MYCFIDRAFT_210858 [Pseudocercospora fijiensis CIRAD86]EME84359.1 hypothetical protein MYCFIDRAFT_210858 [Pseudocercospora fijiensis CIRAD86]
MMLSHSTVRRRAPIPSILLVWSILSSLAATTTAQEINNFTGSLQIVNGNGVYSGTSGGGGSDGTATGAVQAQCPANFPVSCTNIQQPSYCCPSGNYCQWANSVVACCPNGKTCSGSVQAPTTTYYQEASTIYQHPGTTVYVAGGGGIVTTQSPVTVQTVGYAGGGYCSTLVAVGPGLPTTGSGSCGTILIVEADAIRRSVLKAGKMFAMLLALHLMGGLILMRR